LRLAFLPFASRAGILNKARRDCLKFRSWAQPDGSE
jgi:hypothetical protein